MCAVVVCGGGLCGTASAQQNELELKQPPVLMVQNGAAALAQEPASFAIQLDNDVFLGEDCDYTNGIRFSFLSESSPIAPGSFWNWLAVGVERSPELRSQWAATLTQLMYTPNTRSEEPIPGERPYAGYLGLGVGSLVKNKDRANSWEFQLGVTGKYSLADDSQYAVHKFWGMELWPGWQHQIPSELVFQFYFKRFYRLNCLESRDVSGLGSDGYFYWNADVGTLFVRGGGGLAVRYGFNLPGDAATEYNINGANYMTSPLVRNDVSFSDWSVYGVAAIGVQGVAYNAFLDGPVFHDYSYDVATHPVVGTASLGVGVRYKNVEGYFGAQWSSREYASQESCHWVGSLNLRYRF